MERNQIMTANSFCEYYEELLDSTYDCVDRIVLNGYFFMAQSEGGFRTWWRQLKGSDNNLDNTHLMRFAGRFSRRVHAFAEKKGIPLIYCQRGERKHEIAEQYIPDNTKYCGIFCILVSRAPAPVRDIEQFPKGGINIKMKKPYPYVNYYSFHIMDTQWGHMTIKLCPHPPFNAQIILNGHEYVAIQAKKRNIGFTKEGNCFTDISDATELATVADTMRASRTVGHLFQVCERWIYSACLCFAIGLAEQEKSGFHYSYSVYQIEYSRNLLFMRGHTMDQVFHAVIDRTRSLLNIKTVKTIFGYKHRPFKQKNKGRAPRFEAVVERPDYDLTVFKVHHGKLTVKMYSKGERVLRIEVVAHNTKDLRCGKVIERFPQITKSLKEILERFLCVLQDVDTSFISTGILQTWPLPAKVGACLVAGIDVNRPRIRAVMEAVIALSVNPRGFTALDLAQKVTEICKDSDTHYLSRQASYDLKKLRGKQLVRLINHSRRYEATQDGLRIMTAFHILCEKVLNPLLSSFGKRKTGPKPRNQCAIDIHYQNIQIEMQKVFKVIGIAA